MKKPSKLIIDGDLIKHTIAAAAEKRSVDVTHIESGVTKSFKSRTEFYGRGKNVGGALAKMNTHRAKKELEPYSKEDFEYEDKQEAEPVEFCLASVRQHIKHLCNLLGCKNYQVFLGKGECHRHEILLPEGRRYKGQRDSLLRPIHLQAVHDYLVEHHSAIVIEGIETDDHIAKLAYEDWKSGKDELVIVTRDKDQMGCNGTAFNPDWMEKPMKIEGYGSIWEDPKGKLRGTGVMWVAVQLLVGDDADWYWGKKTPLNAHRYGDKTCYKDLKDIDNEKDLWQFVVDKYKEWMPEEQEYIAWNGEKTSDNWYTWLQKHYSLVSMMRWDDDHPQIKDVLEEVGVEW